MIDPADCIIVDDFYRDPDSIRDWVLRQEFSNVGRFSFPGWQADHVVDSPQIRNKIATSVGFEIAVDRDKYTFGGVRLITGLSGKHTKVHADSVSEWAAMVYLTPNPDLTTGTGFFRHRSTGLEGPPDYRTALKHGYSTPMRMLNELVYPDAGNLDAWEQIDQVEPVYNRLIAFRGARYFHAPLGGGGTSREDSRMTHMFFFDEAPSSPALSKL